MITVEVSKVRAEKFGLTGAQLLSKLERDTNANAILRHLLEDVSSPQVELLILELFPQRILELYADERDLGQDTFKQRADLSRAYRTILTNSDQSLRSKAVGRFVDVIREEDGDYISVYGSAFFRGADCEFAEPGQAQIVKDYLWGTLASGLNEELIEMLYGIEPYVERSEVKQFVDPIVKTLVSPTSSEKLKLRVRNYLSSTTELFSDEVFTAISKRLKTWEGQYARTGKAKASEAVASLRNSFEFFRPVT